MRPILSPRAQSDLDDIWEYTIENWGVAAHTKVGRTCGDARPGYRKYPVGSHVVFCRTTATPVVVVRILHRQIDVERHP